MEFVSRQLLINIGRNIIDQYFSLMMINEVGTLEGKDIEALHVMRVSCRRLRVALSVFGELFDPQIPKEIRTALRKTGELLGEIRDFDVLLQYTEADPLPMQVDGHCIFHAFRKYCQIERDCLRNGLSLYFSSTEYLYLKKFFNDFCEEIIPLEQHFHELAELKSFAENAMSKKLSVIPRYEDLPINPVIEQLHQLRIAIKKLRYTMELFVDIYEDDLGDLVTQLRLSQDHLGAIHDIYFLLMQGRIFIQTKKVEFLNCDTMPLKIFIQQEEINLKEMCDTFYPLFKSMRLDKI